MDFCRISTKEQKSNNREFDILVKPTLHFSYIKDLVCKGGSMYAFWNGETWSTSRDDLISTIDRQTLNKKRELEAKDPTKTVGVALMNNHETKLMLDFDKFCKTMEQSNVIFNQRILFSEDVPEQDDYSTNQLNYTPKKGPTKAFDELLGLLYEEKELEKILWFLGALLTNNMSKIQKFMFLYGGKGSGKGTVIKVFKMLFEGYYSAIDLNTLTGDSAFATSQVKEIPLLIDEDSDISRITKDTNLLKLTAHEPITVNVKYKDTYETIFNGLLITASNQRFQVRNIDSGITRRAVVVEPTSYTHSAETYFNLMGRIPFELSHIAYKAMTLFNEKGAYYYEDYMDVAMAEATDYIFSFVRDNAVQMGNQVTLKRVSALFKLYLDDLGYETKGYKRRIKNEMQRYYRNFYPKLTIDGEQVRNVFTGIRSELIFPELTEEERERKFPTSDVEENGNRPGDSGPSIERHGIDFGNTEDIIFKTYAKQFQAQYAGNSGAPSVKWDACSTVLDELDTSSLHYVRLPANHIVIDFDLKGPDGRKSLQRNLEAASKFPPTYAEVSKSGEGIHLHYTYDGPIHKLANLYDDDIEIKKFTGKSSLRRQFTRSNDVKIAHISTGLPFKERDGVNVYNDMEKQIVWNEKKLRKGIIGNLENKYHPNTKPSIDFIDHMLKEAIKNDLKFDVSDLRQAVLQKAMMSTNNQAYCLNVFNQMVFKTIEDEPHIDAEPDKLNKIVANEDLYFLDLEIYPNLFVICYRNFDNSIREALINPSADEVERVLELPFVGFNVRNYDNHIMYGSLVGKTIMELFLQSQGIIEHKDRNAKYYQANELSYVDIWEYSTNKQGLKAWQIELGIRHDEMELPWDQPVPEELWPRVVEYCFNDVDATFEVFLATQADYKARLILSQLSGLPVNAKTQDQAAAFLFGDVKRPQDEFVYTDLSETFPGYKFAYGKSEYLGEVPSEGGFVYSEPGVYENVVVLDIASMHPRSAVLLNYFGPYTQRFDDLITARLHIKHKEYDKAREMFDGVLKPFLETEEDAEALSYALKIIINIVYGMTSAPFDNKFRHPDNIDNIVAKRGALFMVLLKHEMKKQGIKLIHTKTDSVKLLDPTPEQVQWVVDFGTKYGYTFEVEHIYKRMTLVNKAALIGEYYNEKKGKDVWDPVGTMFLEPYTLKTLFTREEIVPEDLYLIKQIKKGRLYLDGKHLGRFAHVYAAKDGHVLENRHDDGRVTAPTGTKGYLFKSVDEYTDGSDVDLTYYEAAVKKTVDAIAKVGDERIVIDNDVYWNERDTDKIIPIDPMSELDERENVEIAA